MDSWWLAAVWAAASVEPDSFSARFAAADGLLRNPAKTDLGAARAFSRLALGVSATEPSLLGWDMRLEPLATLKLLCGAYRQDLLLIENLAAALFNTLNHAKEGQALPLRDALLEELRALAVAYSDDAVVREQLSMGLFNTLVGTKEEQELARRDALLDELRALAGAYPNDGAVREQLAMGLFNTLNHAKEEQELARRDALLDELRALAVAYREDAAVRASPAGACPPR